MHLKVFTFAYRPELGGFDMEVLDRFCLDKEVFEFQSHFFQREGQPFWTVSVRYRMIGGSPIRVDRSQWSERDLVLRQRLREYRLEKSHKLGKPPYIIFTDRQMDAFVRLKVRSLADFGPIKGFGPKKTEQFGADVLGIVKPFLSKDSAHPQRRQAKRHDKKPNSSSRMKKQETQDTSADSSPSSSQIDAPDNLLPPSDFLDE